jgi:hypothetical protein
VVVSGDRKVVGRRGWGAREGGDAILTSAKVLGVGPSITTVERTTSKKMARARLLEARAAAAAEREVRERHNIGDLAEFLIQTAKLDDVEAWLQDRIDKARRDAQTRRERHRLAAGKALQAMRFRGETVAGIAAQAGVTQAEIRGYLKVAAADAPAGRPDEEVGAPEHGLNPVPTDAAGGESGHDRAPTAVGAR